MSKFLEALEEADRYCKAHEPAADRATLTLGGDALVAAAGKLARWIEEGRTSDEGQTLIVALASLLAEQDSLRARAEAAEQESERLRERADGRLRLGPLTIRSTAVLLAAGIGIAAISGWAWLSRGPRLPWNERAALTRPIEGEPAVPSEPTASAGTEREADVGRAGNLPRALVGERSATRSQEPRAQPRVPPARRQEPTEHSRTMTSTGMASTEPDDPGAIIDWLITEKSRAGR
jgi:hypothetical protein